MTTIIRNIIGLMMLVLITTTCTAEDKSNIDLTISYDDGSIETKTFSKTEKKIKFYKTHMSSIDGLEQFEDIDELIFSYTAFINDFAFIEGLMNVKVLVLDTVSISDISFIKGMENLKGLIIQGSELNIELLDFEGTNLEYLEITNSNLKEMPKLENIPDSMNIVNITYNHITEIDMNLVNNRDDITFIFTGNPIEIEKENVIVDYSFYELIPAEYMKYMK